jgi:hypothetical protein
MATKKPHDRLTEDLKRRKSLSLLLKQEALRFHLALGPIPLYQMRRLSPALGKKALLRFITDQGNPRFQSKLCHQRGWSPWVSPHLCLASVSPAVQLSWEGCSLIAWGPGGPSSGLGDSPPALCSDTMSPCALQPQQE